MKCKNIECENETKGKNVYCSLTCRNIFVNKYLRNYEKVSETFQQKKKEREEEYLKIPKKCEFCDNTIPFEKKNENRFCSHSCSASFSNMNRDVYFKEKIRNSIKNYIKINGLFGALKTSTITEKTCPNCNKSFTKKTKYCDINCRREFDRKNMSEYKKYKSDCNFKFNLKDYPDYFDFELVEKYGWYSPTNKKNNLSGVSRDHMFSVREGFEKGINPSLISHPANCELMIHNDNISKNKKSSIIIEELINRIKEFEEKYNNKNI
jgi:hypothetical protein